jgi:hypothetical protein
VSARAKPNLGRYIEKLADSLTDLGAEYRKIGERHATEHDIYHTAHALAQQCEGQAAALAPHAAHHGGETDVEEGPKESLLAGLRRATAALVGRSPLTGMLLLRDLRQLHLAIEESAMLWVIVGQGAFAARDAELLALVEKSREEMTHQLMWVTTRIKETAPQVLAA